MKPPRARLCVALAACSLAQGLAGRRKIDTPKKLLIDRNWIDK